MLPLHAVCCVMLFAKLLLIRKISALRLVSVRTVYVSVTCLYPDQALYNTVTLKWHEATAVPC